MFRFSKILIIFLTLFVSAETTHCQQYWFRIPSPTTKWLKRCHFPDPVNGWVVGDSGVILHTANRGQTWVLQNSTVDFFIDDVYFLNERLGWCAANDFSHNRAYTIKTTNGGINWTSVQLPDTTIVVYTVYFTDSLTGFVGAFGGLGGGMILRTTNSGLNWTQSEIDTAVCSFLPIYKIDFRGLAGLACGGIFDIQGAAWTSTDGGLRWKAQCVAPEPIFNIMWLDSLTAIGTGGDPEFFSSIIRTSDGGNNWVYDTTGRWGIGQNLAYRTPADVWIPLGFSARWAHSIDSTRTWLEELSPDSSSIYAAVFLDTLTGWSFGTGGAIYRYDTSMIGVKNNQNYLPREIKLYQNFPNPFNPKTTIRFEVIKTSRVKIILYDLLGKELRLLTDEIRTPGIYSVSFSSAGLSSGVYFYRIQTGAYSESKKMVILK